MSDISCFGFKKNGAPLLFFVLKNERIRCTFTFQNRAHSPFEVNKHQVNRVSAAGLLIALGIIYGDIGTSPLYVFSAIINGRIISEELILGGLSCVIWTLTLQTTIKYVLLTLKADNKGEGGIFSLYTLVRRQRKWLVMPAMLGGAALLADGIQAPGGKQCALCPRKEREHTDADHTFSPAYYGILTGDIDISPNNEQTITTQRGIENKDGRKIKVLIGSQIASEGVDLRFVRETHIIDSWFHLNKTEQIIGRAIRFLSHCALPKEKRNTTIYLYTAVFPSDQRETADLYSYRIGFKKSVQIGRVTRIMKQSSLDCNLNQEAIVIHDEDPIEQIDSQRVRRQQVNINDMPFTAVCDWIESCSYQCKPSIQVKDLEMDDTTYDEYSARWRMNQLKNRIRALFSETVFIHSENLWNQLSDIPRMVVIDLLSEIVNNKSFQVEHLDENGNAQKGYIRYCNGYYLFQPNVYQDLTIPLAIRIARFPVKRDNYLPIE